MDIPLPHPSDRSLRVLTAVGFPFTLILATIHGAASGKICPALGSVPMAISAVVAALVLLNKLKRRGLLAALDVFLAAFLFGILIPSWAFLGNRWNSTAVVMVGTYGTMPLMINLAIHTFFALREIFAHFLTPRRCPHCHNEIHGSGSGVGGISIGQSYRNRMSFMGGGVGHSRSSKEIYQPLAPAQYDDDARESSEIETTPRPSAETLRSSAAGSSRSAENLVWGMGG